MTEQGYAQQQAIRARRHQQWRVKGWAHVSCPHPRCSVGKVYIEVDEDIDCLPFQAPLTCVRCKSILVWEEWSHE